MKKLSLFLFVMILGVATSLQAKITNNNTNLEFAIDEQSIDNEFAAVAELEKTISQNFVNADFNYVSLNNNVAVSALGANLNLNPTSPYDSDKYPIAGIPSFIWGCGLGLIGVAVVAVIGNDLPKDQKKEEIKKSVYGCLTTSVAYAIYALVIVGSATN